MPCTEPGDAVMDRGDLLQVRSGNEGLQDRPGDRTFFMPTEKFLFRRILVEDRVVSQMRVRVDDGADGILRGEGATLTVSALAQPSISSRAR